MTDENTLAQTTTGAAPEAGGIPDWAVKQNEQKERVFGVNAALAINAAKPGDVASVLADAKKVVAYIKNGDEANGEV